MRREIASHLHGRVRGRLLALRGRLQDLLRGASGLTETGRVVGDVVNNLDQIIKDEVSVLSRQLYPAILRRGLVSALRSLADQFEAVLAIEIELDGGYVNRCVNDIRRRPSQPLIQWRFHPHTVHRGRRLRSTQGPSDA